MTAWYVKSNEQHKFNQNVNFDNFEMKKSKNNINEHYRLGNPFLIFPERNRFQLDEIVDRITVNDENLLEFTKKNVKNV